MSGFESAFLLLGDILRLLTEPPNHGIAVWVLAVVFAWSGIVKLRQPALAAMAMVDFGILRRVRPGLGAALGAAETLLAVSLALGVFPALTLPVAAGLLWLFVALIAHSLLSGEEFACFCFGNADSELSRLTLVRTGALALLASALAFAPAGAYPGFGPAGILQAVSAVALVGTLALAARIPKLLRWNRDPYRLGGMEVGE